MLGGHLIDDDSPADVTGDDVRDEAASLAILVLRSAKRFDTDDRLRLLEAVCGELSDVRDKLRAQIHDGHDDDAA